MIQQATTSSKSRSRVRPKRIEVFFHAIKTFTLLGTLLTDPRVPLVRKALFLGTIGSFLVVLIFPDLLNEIGLSIIFPLAGTVLGVPVDAGFDWAAFSLVVVSLLRLFPAELVGEHYRTIFR